MITYLQYIVPNFNAIACICASVLTILAYLLIQKKKIKKPVNLFLILSGVIVLLFFMVNLWQLPYYTNTIANGYQIEREAILTAKYYNNHKDEYDKVFYIVSENAPYAQAVYAYFPVDIIDISSKTPLPDTSLNSLYIIWDENQQTYVTSTSIPYH